MAVNNFIPAIWSANILESLKKALVYGGPAIVNRDYEGEIQNVGDRVKINAIGRPTISDYAKNTDINSPEALNDAQSELVINKAKYFNFQVDDVDQIQTKPKLMGPALAEAGYAIADAIDQDIAAAMKTDATVVSGLGTDASPRTDLGTVGNAYTYLTKLRTALSVANVPTVGRWVIVPPWFEEKLLLDSTFLARATQAGDDKVENGRVARVAGLDVWVSNNVPVVSTTYTILAGTRMATSFAMQVTKTEAYRPEKRFADAVKGVTLYGVKVIRPASLVKLIANAA